MKKITLRLFTACIVVMCHITYGSFADEMRQDLDKKYNDQKYLTLVDIPYISDVPMPKEVESLLSHIRMTDIEFETPNIKHLIIMGQVNVYGAKSRITIEFISAFDIMAASRASIPLKLKYRLTLQLPLGWKPSDTFPQLKSVDTLKFESVAFNIANFSVAVENRIQDFGIEKMPQGMEVHPEAGFTIVGVAKPAGLLKSVADFLNYHKDFYLVGNIPKNKKTNLYELEKSTFSATIPMAIELIKGLKMTGMQLIIGLDPSFEINSSAALKVPYEKEDLVFISGMKLEPLEVTLMGALDGRWKKPLGVIPITLEDVGLSLTFLKKPIKVIGGGVRGKFIFNEEKEKYVEIALQGKLSDLLDFGSPDPIGDSEFTDLSRAEEVAGDASSGSSNAPDVGDDDSVAPGTEGIVMYGAFKGGIYLEDLVDIYLIIAKEAGVVTGDLKNKVLNIIPNIGFEEASIYFVPKSTEIARMTFRKGTRFMAKANILGQKIIVDVNLMPRGFTGLGYISDLKLGPLEVTGAGPDLKEDTEDDGAVIFIEVSLTDPPRIYIDCTAKLDILGGIKKRTYVDIYKSGVKIELITDLAGLYETSLILNAPMSKPSEFFVKGSMEQSALSKFNKLIKNACNDMIEKSEKDLDKAKKKTTDWWDGKIKSLENSLGNEKEIMVNALRKEEQRLKNIAKNYEENLKKLEKELEEKSKNKFEKAKKAEKKCKKGNIAKCGKAGYYYALGGGTWAASKAVKEMRKNKHWKALNKSLIKATAEVTRVTKQISKLIGDAYIVVNAPAYAFAQGMKYASIGAIETAGMSAQGIAEAGKLLGKLGANAVNIKEISFAADAKDIKGKKLPKVKVKGKVLGVNISMSLQLDLDDVGDFVKKIANEAIKEISKPFKSGKNKPNKPDLSKDALAQEMKKSGKNPEKIMMPYEDIVIITD